MHLLDQIVEQSSKKRNGQRSIGLRLLDRLHLIRSWVFTTFVPLYWKQAILAMFLVTLGKSLEMASFVGAVHIITHAIDPQFPFSFTIDNPLIIGGAILFLIILFAALSGYRGQRLAVETVNDYESVSFANAIHNIRLQRKPGFEVSEKEATEVMMQAPRFMARGMLQIMNSASSTFLMVIGLAGCTIIYPNLTFIITVVLILCSPIYLFAAIHGTSVGHRMRQASQDFGKVKKKLSKKWLASEQYDAAAAHREVLSDTNYSSFLDAYGNRLILSPQSQLIGSLTFSLCLLTGFLWVGFRFELNAQTLSTFIIYLIFLRVFFSGIISIFSSVQMLNSFIPYFLGYLVLDPRVDISRIQELEIPIKP